MKPVTTSLRALIAFTLLLGLVYPLTVSLLGQLGFPRQTEGNLIMIDGKVVGARQVGQAFSSPRYFWPRPSSVNYSAASSGASNLAVTSAELAKQVAERFQSGLRGEMLYASGSGLDPHISPESAVLQVSRVAAARSLPPAILLSLIHRCSERRQFGFLGEPRVNVLLLNVALDELRTP